MPVNYKDLKSIGGLFMLELQGKTAQNATFYRVSERSQVIRDLRGTKLGVAGSFCREAGVTKFTISPKWKRGSVNIDNGDGSMTARSLRVGFLNGDKVWLEWGTVEGDEEEAVEEIDEDRILDDDDEDEDDNSFFGNMFEEVAPTWQEANGIWVAALDTLAKDVGDLQTALRAASKELDDEELMSIADSGLAQLTKGNRTKVQTAVFEVRGSSEAKARTKALKAVESATQDYLDHIAKHPAFAAIEAGVQDQGPPVVSLPKVDLDPLRAALKALKRAAADNLTAAA